MFRVVQDQLKVSEGWVRCGRCETVFNAQERLFDLDHDAPPPWHPPEAQPAPEPISAEGHNDLPPEVYLGADNSPPSVESTDLLADPAAWDAPEPAMAAATDEPIADAEPVFAEVAIAPSEEPHDTGTARESDAAGPPADLPAPADDAPSDDVTPEFLRQARRKERWQQPAVRGLLGVLVVASTLLLAGQVIHHHRQLIAARYPSTVPWLERFCALAQCRIGTLQRIADVSIETTALTQVPEPAVAADEAASAPSAADAHLLRLAITLRNRGEWPIAMPDVDLSLTGSDGELVARRSLSPHDFGVADPQLLPGQDLPLSLRFRVASGRVSGYTVEVFYP